MAVYSVTDKTTIAKLFGPWEETMIWSCLQGCMGSAYTDTIAGMDNTVGVCAAAKGLSLNITIAPFLTAGIAPYNG